MRVLALRTGVFPDEDTVRDALRALEEQGHDVVHADASAYTADENLRWDYVVMKILAARKVVTV